MSLSVLIIEDEFVIAEDIRFALLSNGYKVFGIARSVAQALELLKKEKPDFALVDITLGTEQAGLQMGRIFHETLKIPYIYITSHSDIATLEKVKLTSPNGYLLKPFKREAIYAAIEVALLNFNGRGEAGAERQYMMFRKGEERIKVLFQEILFAESDSNYTHIQTVTTRFTERKTLKELLDEWPSDLLVRVHKSFAVNGSKIRSFTRDKILVGDHEIPVGRVYYDALKEYLR